MAFAVLASACSTGFIYQHLDWLLIRHIEGYVELNDAQKQHIRADFAQLGAALEQRVIPDLQALLEEIAHDNEQHLMDDHLEQYMQQFKALYIRAVRLVEPGIVALSMSLDSKQQNQLFDELERRNEKFHRKYVAKGETHAKRKHMRDLRKNTKKWLGKIGVEQDIALQAYDAIYKTNEQRWLDSRQRWQTALKSVLAMTEVDAKRAGLKKLMLQAEDYWTPEYHAAAEHNIAASMTLTRQLAAHMSAGQRTKFARELGKSQEKIASFAQAFATTSPQETAGQQSSPTAAIAALPPADQPHTAYSH